MGEDGVVRRLAIRRPLANEKHTTKRAGSQSLHNLPVLEACASRTRVVDHGLEDAKAAPRLTLYQSPVPRRRRSRGSIHHAIHRSPRRRSIPCRRRCRHQRRRRTQRRGLSRRDRDIIWGVLEPRTVGQGEEETLACPCDMESVTVTPIGIVHVDVGAAANVALARRGDEECRRRGTRAKTRTYERRRLGEAARAPVADDTSQHSSQHQLKAA